MHRLLIVDDEPYVVEAMAEMLQEIDDLGVELYTACASEDAVQLMTRAKMDIVLSDIRMPGMDGLELQRWIQARWPRCKVIFLTGMSDIQYIQHALRNGGVDYILKTEGDEAVERAIRKAIGAIREEAMNEQALVKARNQMSQAMPLLRKDWFHGLLDPQRASSCLQPARLQEAEVPLRTDCKALLVAGRVDRWREEDRDSGRMLLLYAIQNIAEEYLARVAFLPVILGSAYFVWLVQPAGGSEAEWDDTASFVLGTLESIQSTCKDLLRLPVSLVTTGRPCAWEELAAAYRQLKQTMILGLGDGTEMLLTHCETEAPRDGYAGVPDRRLAELEQLLESGRQEEWNLHLDELFAASFPNYASYVQAYYTVAVMLLKHMNEWGAGAASDGDGWKKLMDVDSHPSRESAVTYLKGIASSLTDRRQRNIDERTHKVIQKINQHIREHLADDLSLDALASVVYLNASYLSTLYKQFAGVNLSDVIADLRIAKAQELLVSTPLKIHEIAVRVGFGTSGYFTRYFKKHTGVTPQEYRAAHEA
ncbi:response regulator transcription factor [Paenibacillus sp.]|uniref:response regulator transcription factor n=1 Tax=Paenibacillus sp. TaxID=58172 RepID=UPI002D52BF2B|nr:response regulator [Paenibacillus sp.]HZG86276.1 response regulator [Paenibacillus sp.]